MAALYANSHPLKSMLSVSFSSTHTHGTGSDFFEVLSRTFSESKFKDFPESIYENEHAKNCDYLSDSDLEGDEDALSIGRATEMVAPSQGTRYRFSLLFTLNDKSPSPTDGELIEPPTKGAFIKIHNFAFIVYVSSRESNRAL